MAPIAPSKGWGAFMNLYLAAARSWGVVGNFT